ncbi:uncharacterized protein LOC113211246 [Frankliniella occidentalis]|uniref:Uncharacterized protein LOC113211246 n=1 Tax=Frankliniella occidentalis TaxID=133901 RepID=A0A9C6U8U5_FRAOC|nr:uncharacterized protein LOC113211246 [Frankliniella occidentalis]XP_052124044.1 uncharacterized protein LOC113211246 [Frankliniella occidentalis]
METLPDDALLEVMQYLKIEDLLACRLVCRRLGALAMLPELWRHQRLKLVSSDDTPRYNQCSVLRLAPCLRAWHVDVPLQKFHSLYTTTRCAVKKLALSMYHVSEEAALEASLVIRNQAALGRLRRLSVLRPYTGRKAIEKISVLLGTVASTPLLEKLKLTGFAFYPPSALVGLHRLFPESSLKSFEHDPDDSEAESLCDFILSTHAATLQTVNLGYYPLTSTSTATLLAGIPNLRRLECGVMPGLEAVAGCKLLREIGLCVAYDGEARTVAEFLRRATQLVKVTFQYDSHEFMALSSDVDFVLALATTGRSRLEELEIDVYEEHFPQQQSLLKALPRLPALKHLEVRGEASDDFLLGISPAKAPALRTLKVFTISAKCAHDALHQGSVQNLLSLNPDLKFSTHELSYCYTDERCAWCTLGCHQEMRQDLDPPLQHSADWVTISRL